MVKRIVSDLIESNTFVVSHGNRSIIIDAGADMKKVKDVIGNNTVLGIFLTHGHYDHCYHAMEYANFFNCNIYASEKIEEYLKNPDYNYSDGQFQIDEFSKFKYFSGNGKLNIDSFEISYTQLGGHSKSDMCFVVDTEIFVGDVLIGRDIGRMDLYGGNKTEMKNSLEFLLDTDYSVMHSGHGEDNSKGNQTKIINLWLKFLNR